MIIRNADSATLLPVWRPGVPTIQDGDTDSPDGSLGEKEKGSNALTAEFHSDETVSVPKIASSEPRA